MVERFTSEPIELPRADKPISRADLIFYGLDHSGPSFEGQVFLDTRGVGASADRGHRAYVGSFFLLGHGGCFGELGHCEVPKARDPFDPRPPHQLEPAIRILTVTEPVRAALARGAQALKVTVNVLAEGGADYVLAFETVRLATYA